LNCISVLEAHLPRLDVAAVQNGVRQGSPWGDGKSEMAKKLSTADILKAARSQAGQGGEAPPASAADETPAAPPARPQAAAEAPTAPTPAPAAPVASSGAPKSTKDILAAARDQSARAGPPTT